MHTTEPEATITVWIFPTRDGRRGHLVQVEGALSPLLALKLAARAIAMRLRRRLW